MCDCVPDNFRPGSRCKRKFYTGRGGISIFNINLEYTIVHFWLYMVFIGIIIGFILKTVGCYFHTRNCKDCKRANYKEEEEEEEEIEENIIGEEEEEVVEAEEDESSPPAVEPEAEAYAAADDDDCHSQFDDKDREC